MSVKHVIVVMVIAVFTALFATGFWLSGVGPHLYNTHLSGSGGSLAEPDAAAAKDHFNQISILRREPLSFGAVVPGLTQQYFTLNPEAEMRVAGTTLDQRNVTYIGSINAQRYDGSRYQVQSGRLTFRVTSATVGEYVLIRFLPGELGSGVTFSRLDIRNGPDTYGVRQIESHRSSNEVMFKIINSGNWTSSSTNGVDIDLIYGGRLGLAEF